MLSKILVILTIVILFLFFFLPIYDTDFGWHYRCGHEILNGNSVCLFQNTYSYLLPDYRFSYPKFGYDTTLAFIYDHFGLFGVSFFGAIIMTLAYGIVLFIYPGPLNLKVLLIFLSIFGGWSVYSLGYRSQSLSLLFLAFELYILQKTKLNFKGTFLLLVLFLIWTNANPGFFLGPLVLGIYLLSKKLASRKLVFFSLCLAATLINPYTWHIYKELFFHLTAHLDTLIAEWTKPELFQIVGILISVLILTVIFVKEHLKPGYLYFLTLLFAFMAFFARRNLSLYYFTLLVCSFEILSRIEFKKAGERIINLLLSFVLIIVFILYAGNLSKTKEINNNYLSYCQNSILTKLPCRGVDFFRNKKGNVYAMYEWGGFLIWQLPNMKFFVDGRMPAWPTESGKSPYTIYLEIIQTQPGWQKTLDLYKTDYIFIAPGTFLDLALEKNKGLQFGWKEEYRDQNSVIYKRLARFLNKT